MAPTVEEILRQSGLTDEQIKTLDQKVLSGFSTVLTTAASAEAEAAEKLRLQQHMYENDIVPALNTWGTEKATLEATVEFYKKQNEGARTAGFIPKDAPGYTAPATDPTRDGNGRFVPGANAVPGSPAYMTVQDGYKAVTNATWLISEHMRLFGAPPADDIETVIQEANANRMDFRQYASRKFKFDEKKAELTAAKQREHDEGIRKEERAKADKEWSERTGNNPMVRPAAPSQFASVRKAVDTGALKDPLKMSPEERRQQTRQMIHTDIAEPAESVAAH